MPNKSEPGARLSTKECKNLYVESSYMAEIMNERKRIYDTASGNMDLPVHLGALKDLCALGEYNGLECSWVYEAFSAELKSKYQTNLQKFYLGGFVAALLDHEVSLYQARAAIKSWIGLSVRHIENSYYMFRDHRGFSLNSLKPMLAEHQALEVASAVINNINKPFPNSRASHAYKRLEQSIKEHGYRAAQLPFDYNFCEKNS